MGFLTLFWSPNPIKSIFIVIICVMSMYTHCLYIAIWSEKAKNQMIRWAIKAGLIRGDVDDDSFNMKIRNQIQIVYEPDCAALSIQHAVYREMVMESKSNQMPITTANKKVRNRAETEAQIPQIQIDVPLKEGDKYLLLDVGGGTCDVACHRVAKAPKGQFAIAEVLPPSGLIIISPVTLCRRDNVQPTSRRNT